MVLSPLASTDYVLRTWWRKLGDTVVRWFPGSWRLKDRKVREQFQALITLDADLSSDTILSSPYDGGKSIVDFYRAKAWKTYKTKSKEGKITTTIILYFDSQDALLMLWRRNQSQVTN
ncbi:hypothetical protein RclHR1_09980004 [Rhizophagus clarus]|uniref:Uncharacterized protein n=1 Tax=Rhizophagus clarus TaxID=94130 RepID=A0A2Z6SIQ9_9GLOM|nr:hypothetical protein RclHR1_09980004 [Rhizophagus clarus]GES72748.1 hypothetical protein GLOIN_2v1676095 [Rhizophagus clarus]